MKHRAGLDRSQTLMFPERLEDYIAPENPVRFLDAFVAQLDLAALGFGRTQVAATGSPPYDPAMLLKLYLYGYLHRVRSSRLLEAECQKNVEVIWLTGKQAPDHKTIANFRKDHAGPFRAVHRQFRVACQRLNLFGAQLVGLDGTKLAGVNSKDANFNEKKLRELMARANAQLAEYVQALDAADAAEPVEPRLSRAELQARIAALQEKTDWHAELLVQLDGDQTQISVTDPDSRRMRASHGGSVVGYNAQAAVDHKNKLIVADDVTNEETDLRQLSGMAREAKANLGVERLEVVADTGYSTTAEVATCQQHGITAYVPKADTSANTAQGLYGKSRFQYDAAKDVYVCPAGTALTYRFSTDEKGRQVRYYRTSACKACALKPQCTRNRAGRTITREQDEVVMEAMAARVAAQPEKLKLRKQLCEHPFGTIKRFLGYTHFLVKGLVKVRGEWSLITLAYNLKRVLNLVSFEKLMSTLRSFTAEDGAAVGVKVPQSA
jgi:transposase